jgi:thiamine biosynthesis lipoprotein
MKKILKLCEETKKETNGYFDINLNGILDPSGLVKGYAIFQGSLMLKNKGFRNFYVEIAGDIQVFGKNENRENWKVGIQNPFNLNEIVKVVKLSNKGIATSGIYRRGGHIYNPKEKTTASEIASISVIGPNIYEADRFATVAFAMGEKGIEFIEKLKGFEGYMIKKDRQAILTSGFEDYIN